MTTSRRAAMQFGCSSHVASLSLWGQSNAESVTSATTALPSGWVSPQPNIRVATYGAVPTTHGAFGWLDMQPGVNSGNVYQSPYWGVEQALCHDLLARYSTVYLDKLAAGGYSIDNWRSGGNFYDELLTIASDEKASFTALGLSPVWLPVVWIQGEGDAGGTTAAYQAKLEALIDQERSLSVANRPWIFQKLSSYQTYFGADTRAKINLAFANIAGGTRANCYTLDPGDFALTMVNDQGGPFIHYDGPSSITLGHAYFDLMVARGLLP